MARKHNLPLLAIALAAVLLMTVAAVAQTRDVPATRPAGKTDGSLLYQVVQVKGKVRIGPTGLNPLLSKGWSRVQVGDHVGPGKQICVPFRGAVKLVACPAKPPTVILLERGTLLNFAELSLRGGVAKTRIELRYGAIRAGVAEGQTRSDMEIKAPIATLSKRGTDIFRFEYRNRRFVMSLTEHGRGMIQAIQMQSVAFGARARLRSRLVTPGQYVTHQMARAIDNVQFDRQINVGDMFGLQGLDQLATLLNDSGLGFLIPQGTNLVNHLDTVSPDGQLNEVPLFDPDASGIDATLARPAFPTTVHQNAGDFGIGQGVIPGVFGFGAKTANRPVLECRDSRPDCKQRQLHRLGRKH
jgi:hypothetical protein